MIENDLATFFGSAPVMAEKNKPWAENTSIYTAIDQNRKLVLAIEPMNTFIAIMLREKDQKLLDFSADGLRGLKIIDDKGLPTLRILINNNSAIQIQLKPHIWIYQSIDRTS